MSDILAFYQEHLPEHTHQVDWVKQLQHEAAANFAQLGFPGRMDEEWKYTSVAPFLKQRFAPALNVEPQVTAPSEVVVQSLAQALAEPTNHLHAYLGKIQKIEHGFHALNLAMLHAGVVIQIPAHCKVTTPIWIKHIASPGQAAHLRYLIVAGEGSQVTIIEEYVDEDEASSFTNAATEMHLAPHAHVTHYKLQQQNRAAFHVSHVTAKLMAHSQVESHLVNLGGHWVRTDTTLTLCESHSSCSLNGLYIPHSGQHMDQHTQVDHAVSECRSEQDYKGIIHNHARAVFNGKVNVASHAQRTVAEQQNKNLLLGSQAEIDTKPQLEIFADDVVCSHGATVGQLDEDALFYLATRGIDEAQASQYLVQAFVADNLARMTEHQVQTWLSKHLSLVSLVESKPNLL